MKRTTTNIIFILSIVLLVASVGGYVYLYSTFTSAQTDIETLNAQLGVNQSTYNELEKAENNLKTTEGTSNKLGSLFVQQDSIVDFIQLIESTMKQNHLTGGADSVAEETTPTLDQVGKEKLVVALTAKGDWNDLLKFVGLLEKLPYKSTINSVTWSLDTNNRSVVSPTTKGSSTPKLLWQAKVNLFVLVIKTPGATGGAPTQPAAPQPTTDEEN